MRKSFLLLFVIAGLALGQAQTRPQTQPQTQAMSPNCAALVQQALELSGFMRGLDEATEMMNSEAFLTQITGKNDPDFNAMFLPILHKDLDPQAMKKDLQRRVATRCDVQQMTRVLEAFHAPVVTRMMQLETDAGTPEGKERTRKYAKVIAIAPPTDSQMGIIDAFDRATGQSEFAADSMMAVTRGMFTGMAVPPEVLQQVEQQRRTMQGQIQDTIQRGLLVVYHSASKADMEGYGQALSSEPLKGFLQLARKSFVEMMSERAETIGQDLKEALTAPKKGA